MSREFLICAVAIESNHLLFSFLSTGRCISLARRQTQPPWPMTTTPPTWRRSRTARRTAPTVDDNEAGPCRPPTKPVCAHRPRRRSPTDRGVPEPHSVPSGRIHTQCPRGERPGLPWQTVFTSMPFDCPRPSDLTMKHTSLSTVILFNRVGNLMHCYCYKYPFKCANLGCYR